MKRTVITVGIVFNNDILGSSSGNPEIHKEYIASKAPTLAQVNEETEAIGKPVTEEEQESQLHKATTIFPSDATGVFCWDYQWRGFIKESVGVAVELGDINNLSKWTYKRACDSIVFVKPRRIYFRDAAGLIIPKVTQYCERPLRADTMQGERVALARSEMLPEGTQCEFTIELLGGENPKSKVASLKEEHIIAALDYGALKGFGQWRSGGKGTFTYTVKEVVKS